jgi:long-chain acyl-CoA synthetase
MSQGDAAELRASIDKQVAGKTICHILERNVAEVGDKPALSWKDGSAWRHMTWREYRERAAEAAMGLRSLGLERGEFAAIMARNRPEHFIADLGILHAGGIPVSFYNTLAPEQIHYIAEHCNARIAVVEGREFMERWEKVRAELPDLRYVVMLDDAGDFTDYDWVLSWDQLLERGRDALAADGRAAFEEMWSELKPEDPVTVIYTSGTTGPPKGVVITNYNVLWTSASLERLSDFERGMKFVSYLPLAHSAERFASHYIGMWLHSWVHFCPDVQKVFEIVPEVRPDAFVGVPRVWEKLQAGISAKLAAEPNERKRKIAMRAIDAGRSAVRFERERGTIPFSLKVQRGLFEKLVFSKVRHAVGLDKCKLAITAAAPISPETHDFFAAIGLPLIEIYGMTESTAPALTNTIAERKVGTVGRPLPGVEIKVLDDGELLMRGGLITQGYYKEPEKTAEAFDSDGWLHTGDVVTVDDDGFVKIVDRKRELIITAGGKNIAPSNLESLLKLHPLVGQVCVIGDRKPFISALIVLDMEVAPSWAAQNGIEFTNIEEFTRNDRVVAAVQEAVDGANGHVSQVEKIKRFTILPAEWTPFSDELTPTLKLKRRVIHSKYAREIEDLYG